MHHTQVSNVIEFSCENGHLWRLWSQDNVFQMHHALMGSPCSICKKPVTSSILLGNDNEIYKGDVTADNEFTFETKGITETNDYDKIADQVEKIVNHILMHSFIDTQNGVITMDTGKYAQVLIDLGRLRGWANGLAESHRKYSKDDVVQ